MKAQTRFLASPMYEATVTRYQLQVIKDLIPQKMKTKEVSPMCVCIITSTSVHGIFQTRILEWVAISFSSGSSQPRDWTYISCVFFTGRWVLYQLSHWRIPVIVSRLLLTGSCHATVQGGTAKIKLSISVH